MSLDGRWASSVKSPDARVATDLQAASRLRKSIGAWTAESTNRKYALISAPSAKNPSGCSSTLHESSRIGSPGAGAAIEPKRFPSLNGKGSTRKKPTHEDCFTRQRRWGGARRNGNSSPPKK